MKKLIYSLFLFFSFSLFPFASFADEGEFDLDRWYEILQNVQDRATQAGVSAKTINDTIQNAAFMPEIVRLDKNQAEFKQTMSEYLEKRVPRRAETGRAKAREYRTLLRRTYEMYAVPTHVILAFWGLESNYGANMGNHKISDSFLTLIYDGRREKLFTDNLINLMKLADKDKLKMDEILGGWAGAMGHFQFMPATLDKYGADGNNDGKIDVRNTLADAMFSAGNYLSAMGWNATERIIHPVTLPIGFDMSMCDGKTKQLVSEWAATGVAGAPDSDITVGMICDANCVQSDDSDCSAWLAYPNFYIIRRWNSSNLYALSVALLAEELK
ncbi:hypothetical protein FACS189421_08600 [Bacteroidia bacterium]|nr:hypothetical protein FACS189421_08600 [Bacteroidia bacterium]